MPHIDINFDDVPDSIPPIDPGIYLCSIKEVEQKMSKKGDSENVVVQLRISEGPATDRVIFDYINLSPKRPPIALKQLCKSAGLKVGADGLNIEDLLGKTVKVRVKNRTYKDAETGEVKESTNVAEYLFE